MDYFRKYLGGPQDGGQPTGAETVERLCDRVQSSTLLDDRRDAVRALKALSKKFRLEVGTQAMGSLIKVLETDRNDAEITGYALDTLCHVMSNEPTEEDEEIPNHDFGDLGAQFTEIFIKSTENIALLLSLLEEYDFHVRWPTVRLVTILLTNRCKDMQEVILVSPMGVSKLMDLLSDSREIIRNDALLLLIQLTKSNANIQKIVAFENAFERLMDIVREEGYSDGGIVVEDCLLLNLNLLKNNISNQNFFKEGSFIQRLTPFFDLESDMPQAGWSAQKVTNIHLMLQLVRTLVSPSNPHQHTLGCQRAMNHCGLLQQVCTILMASGVPADVLTETINTVSEVIRGNQVNQEYFASVMAPSNPPRPAIVVLLMSMVNEKQPFVLRCAVLYCFQSFLYKNEVGQSQIIHTLLPSTSDANTITAGQLLCGGLFSADSLSNWFAAVAMLHAVLENHTQKEQLLRVQLATSLGNPPVSLLQQCCNILAQGGKLQTRIGLLMLLCAWVATCPIAVTHFLYNTANVPYLISQVSSSEGDEQEMLAQGLCAFLLGLCVLFNDDQNETFSRSSLKQIIEKRIGLETFTDKLTKVMKHESYTRAAKKPNLNYRQPNDIIFDFEFTRTFKILENEVLKSTTSLETDDEEQKKVAATMREHESIVDQYKGLIRDQDQQLQLVRQECEDIKKSFSQAQKQIEEMAQQVQQLKDQNALYKAKQGAQGLGHQILNNKPDDFSELELELETLKGQLREKDTQIEKMQGDLTYAQSRVLDQYSREEDKENNPSEVAVLQTTINRLSSDLDEVRRSLAQKEAEVKQIQGQLEMAQAQAAETQQNSSKGAVEHVDVTDLNNEIVSLKDIVKQSTEDKVKLQERLTKSNEENLNLLDKIKKLDGKVADLENEKKDAKDETETLRKEQDDLLVLLADQDQKVDQYKAKLKVLGEEMGIDNADILDCQMSVSQLYNLTYKLDDDDDDDDDEEEDEQDLGDEDGDDS